jgi:hypothetical protein
MKIPLRLKGYYKYLEVIRMLSNIKYPIEITPYNKLRNREMEVLAIMYYFYNEKHADIPEEKRDTHLFSYEARQEIVDMLSAEGTTVSKETVYNIMMDLRKKGFIDAKSIIKSHIIGNIDEISFKFV